MLSVLIPIYNYNVQPLIIRLHQQLLKANISFEILCIDDATPLPYPYLEQEIGRMTHTRLLKLDKNIGRSRIRNLLAKKATHEWLLFLDADCIPISSDFIENYLSEIKNNTAPVLCGGITYQSTPPEKSQMLRWKYGRAREQQQLATRQAQPYRLFFSANFVALKTVFLEVQFDETLREYGLEDTLFAVKLKAKNHRIIHLENPVEHQGLDSANAFLQKTKSAISNGYTLFTQQQLTANHLKHLSVYLRLKKMGLLSLFRSCYWIGKPLINANLRSQFPALFFFDLFKVYTLSQRAKQQRSAID